MKKIMVVDDEAIIVSQLEGYLARMGYDVMRSAFSADEALDVARKLKPDLMLMDIVMPGDLDGIEAARIIKNELNIPVIFVSAFSDEVLIEKVKNAEPYGYLVKPFQENELKAAIEVALYKRETEQRLRESDERYRRIFENIRDVYFEINIDGTILEISPSVEEQFHYPREELIGKSSLELYAEPKQREELMKAILKTGEVFDYEILIKNKEGSLNVFSTNAKLITDMQGNPERIAGSMCNITKRKCVEHELKNYMDYLISVLNCITDPIVVKNRQHRWTLVNDAFCMISGRTRKELLDKSDYDFFPKHEADVFYETDEEVFRTGEEVVNEGTITDSKNVTRTIITNKTLCRNPAGEKFVVAIGRDITGQKKMEKEREKLIEELQEALAKVKTLSGFLPICSSCKKIRDDKGYWTQVEEYVREHSDAEFSHGLCPDCAKKLYPDIFKDRKRKDKE